MFFGAEMLCMTVVPKNETPSSSLEKSFILEASTKIGITVEAKEHYRSSLPHSNVCDDSLYSTSSRKFILKSLHTSDIWRGIHVSHHWGSSLLNNIP